MGTKTKIKSQLRLHGFEPKGSEAGDWRNFFNGGFGVAEKDGKAYLFSQDADLNWTVENAAGVKNTLPLSAWGEQHGIFNLEGPAQVK